MPPVMCHASSRLLELVLQPSQVVVCCGAVKKNSIFLIFVGFCYFPLNLKIEQIEFELFMNYFDLVQIQFVHEHVHELVQIQLVQVLFRFCPEI
jgi:hypothetical protein